MTRVGALGRLLAVATIGAFGGGCFVGDAADGLPCEQDADCGLGAACVEDPALEIKCCGGSCLLSSSSGPDASSSSSDSTGPASQTGTESSTGSSVCGDGTIDPGEACDPGPGSGSPPCGSDCELLCGNGSVDEGEQCDDDEPSCGGDCQFSMTCGNEELDPGEACDVRLAESETCLDDCKTWVALDWGGKVASADFCVDETASKVGGPWECTRWTDSQIAGERGSGPYFGDGDVWVVEPGSWPEAILRTRAIDFPELAAGDSVEIAFDHELDFNSNPDDMEAVDYAELSIESADNGGLRFVPLGGVAPLSVEISCSGQSSDASCTTAASGDYCQDGLRRTAGRTDAEEAVTAVVSTDDEPLAGLHRLRFLVRYDCANFDDAENPISPDAWILHRLKVTVRKAEDAGDAVEESSSARLEPAADADAR